MLIGSRKALIRNFVSRIIFSNLSSMLLYSRFYNIKLTTKNSLLFNVKI